MISSRSTQKITETIKQKDEFLQHEDIRSYYNPRYGKLHAISLDYAASSDPNPTSIIKLPATSHGLASAILHAYTLHQHLQFSPDDVWLTITQGVSRHILGSAERYRYLFVDHAGQKDVLIDAQDIIGVMDGNFFGDWAQAIERLSSSVDEQVKKVDLKRFFECDFSTTTNASVTSSRIVLLEAMKKYFRYSLRVGCGIPKVTLDGTLEDWLHLQEKVRKLHDLGLDLNFWLEKLEPVIAQFVATYRGNVDEKFWSMVMTQVPYGSGSLTDAWDGWIAALFPSYSKAVVPSSLPQGLIHVPFKLKIENIDYDLQFGAGFLGARQDQINGEYVVSPVIGWYIIDDPNKHMKMHFLRQ
ncbi:13729_t:CDS:1 [Acaulospora colombiana]|uniref:13729_t:CDS:1 n=1 Tax=Acaulospora colombiana TaxID=27376 RepID=A0ACA9KHG2_9GLOM|nr:13729_t:CDS:1 [Acaulospora colombiana]